MTEDQKYQGALYKEKNNKKQKLSNTPNNQQHTPVNKMAQQAYVEDVEDAWQDYQGQTEDEKSPADFPPEAPTPPAAVEDDNVNVFDFLVATGQTPNASNTNLVREQKELEPSENTSLVRYEYNAEEYLDPSSILGDAEPLVQYGAGSYETPAPIKTDRKKRDGEKSDKKRKRLHVEVPGDQVMTDAPPVLHSGLTGGLKGLMKLPPSPGDSGADANDPLPTSPLKKSKSKHSKHHGQVSNSIFGMMTSHSSSKSKSKKRKTSTKKSSSRHHREKSPKLLENGSRDTKNNEEGQMILFKPHADLFMDFVNKGPESERGCSMNKVLKRFHRERQAAGSNMSKHMEEKELWRSIRLRRNEQGEIVLFSVED
jgi:cell growth-regulating nucleolar protein